MGEKLQYIDTREKYISCIKKELLGPGSEVLLPDIEHELISSSPEKRYSIGIMFPKNIKLNAENDDNMRIEENPDEDQLGEELKNEEKAETPEKDEQTPPEEESLDEEIGLAAQNMPSSFGITFLVSKDIAKLFCSIKFATYKHAKVDDCRIPYAVSDPENYKVPEVLSEYVYFDRNERTLRLNKKPNKNDIRQIKEKDLIGEDDAEIFNGISKLSNQLQNGYVRIPHGVKIDIDFSKNDYSDNNRELDGTKAKITSLKRKIRDDLYSITVMMVNDTEENPNGSNCILQPEISVSTDDNDFRFCEYSALIGFDSLDDEEKSLELQYRNKKTYGTGLGTSVNWKIDSEGKGVLYSDFFPTVEVPNMDFDIPEGYDIDKNALSMRYLSDLDGTPKEEKIKSLIKIVTAYENWIKALSDKSINLDKKYSEIAAKNIAGCHRAAERMNNGVSVLASNEIAWKAFCLSNRAMFMQRIHIKLQEKMSNKDRYPGDEDLMSILDDLDYRKNDGDTADEHFWRLFQIAFLLMSINSIVDDTSEEKSLVDLIWFPTGGGKTEAYLGLTAFTIFYRRLAYPDKADGTAVIMRYTLRLLASQQFTRASTLICACENIRVDATSRKPQYGRYPLGKEPITIGLWIGREHIPNKDSQASEFLSKLKNATAENLKYVKDRNNKFQMLKCPWCGTKMVKDVIGGRLKGVFGYRMRNNRHFELFCPQESCFFNMEGKLPIQIIDEELYENPPTLLFGTVDKFAMLPWKKEIGSFFGVRNNNRAPELIIQDELHLISGPLGTMVGLYESAIDKICEEKGNKPKIVASTATIRRASEQCSALYNRDVVQFPHPGLDAEDSFFAREASINYEEDKFGREYVGLMPSGKTKAMMEARSIAALMQTIHMMIIPDDIKDKYWTLATYFGSLKDLGKCSTIVQDDVKDFIRRTSIRLGSTKDIRRFVKADELTSRVSTTELNETLEKLEKAVYTKEKTNRYPSDILLATNMISVGIDVARLNVMLLVGQPKLTSEYIQASSRIGRTFPGVAFTMYDGSKSRDRSHFEQFKSYHESFYKIVEPTGVTPFSQPALDRALHAVIVAILRNTVEELSEEESASAFDKEKYSPKTEEIKNYLVRRAKEILEKSSPGMEDDSLNIVSDFDLFLEKWERMAKAYKEGHFYYGEKFMMQKPDEGDGYLLKQFNTRKEAAAVDTMTSMRNVDSTVSGNVLVWEE